MAALGLIDGKIIGLREKIIEIEDRGYQFGDGVYEVTRIYNGRPFALQLHLERLARSLRELRIPNPYSSEEIAGFHALLIEKSGIGEGTVYLQITRGVAPRGHAFPDEAVPRLTMSIQPPASKSAARQAGAAAIFVPDERWLRCDIKSINLLGNLLAKQRAKEAGVYEAVQVRLREPLAARGGAQRGRDSFSNESLDGVVTEGSSSNFFAVKNGALWTHPANHLILRGISRTVIVQELAPKLGLAVVEEPFDVAFAKGADEAFLASTSVEIMPLVSLDGAAVAGGKVGVVTCRLMEAFSAFVAKECGIRR
jgi:D-alanine transaminase